MYPGVIDTELFHLPDNDPLADTGVEMLPVDAMVEPVLDMIEKDKLEVAVPDWFAGVMRGKYQNVAALPRRHHRLRPLAKNERTCVQSGAHSAPSRRRFG